MTSAVEEAGMFVVEGVLSELHVELGTQNLLERVLHHYRGSAGATGAAAAAGDLYGQLATAASLAMHDGEETQNFICLIDGHVVCGQFGGAQWLKSGQRVRAVVSDHDGALLAHGIVDPSSGLLWVGHPWGAEAERRANWKLALWGFVFSMVCWALFATLADTGSWSFWDTVGMGAASSAVICAVMALWAGRDMQALAAPSTEIFRLLGFADPARVNLNDYRIGVLALAAAARNADPIFPEVLEQVGFQKRDVYSYRHAEQDGRLRIAI